MTDNTTTSGDTSLRDLPLFKKPAAHRLAGASPAPAAPPAVSETEPAVTPPVPTFTPKTSTNKLEDHFEASLPEHPAAEDELSVDDMADVDWDIVRDLRERMSDRISHTRMDASASRLERDTHGQIAWDAIRAEFSAYQARRLAAGQPPLEHHAAVVLCNAVMDAQFGLGRLERYLHEDGLEDIIVRGCDNVHLVYGDGRIVPGPPAASSDAQLIADLQHYAQNAPEGQRPFSPAAPRLNLSIGKAGHRLSASAWFTARPTVTIRRQGYTHADLSDLERLGALDEGLRHFLTAAIEAGISIIVSGLPSAGKTTMIRALLNELEPTVGLATIETEYELALHNMPDKHAIVWPAQYKPGGEDGAGEVTLIHAIEESLRQSVDRIVVGEVRGQEIVAMFEAMQAGKGSVSTIHANSAMDTIERVVTVATKTPQLSTEFAYREVAAHINLIVHIDVLDERKIGGRKLRYIDEVIALFPAADSANHGIGVTKLYERGPDGRAVPTGNTPAWIERLQLQGFDPSWLTNGESHWREPLESKLRSGGAA